MFDVKKCLKLKNVAVFAGGVLFGTAGVKVLGSQDAKKLYINCLAAGLRAKECVMTTASNIQANAEDVLAEAKEINRARAARQLMYNFLASWLPRTLTPAVPKRTPPANTATFLISSIS